ncbi:hypothetical protein [Bacillus sp. T33-2]|uniref:hypothetical protein n=1 Tax=Bacillus sp. T33-2 TaxID=2054168 RepID=UPI000C791D20|nr:hypothetical protein [Bacillus sp. T33-2]PLR95516.1 hypothetical protein CVD19_13950 [Bacillus sp. T33-2]
MTVNHGGTLKKEYFLAYLKLLMSFRNCSVKEAESLTFELFFKNDKDAYGAETYYNFLKAVRNLNEEKKALLQCWVNTNKPATRRLAIRRVRLSRNSPQPIILFNNFNISPR